MQWDGLDVPLVIINGKLNMPLFYMPDFSYKEVSFMNIIKIYYVQRKKKKKKKKKKEKFKKFKKKKKIK